MAVKQPADQFRVKESPLNEAAKENMRAGKVSENISRAIV